MALSQDTSPVGDACADCARPLRRGDLFMLRDDVWNAVARPHEIVCAACIEKRLGRPLAAADFAFLPLNLDFLMSQAERIRFNAMLPHAFPKASEAALRFIRLPEVPDEEFRSRVDPVLLRALPASPHELIRSANDITTLALLHPLYLVVLLPYVRDP